MSNSLEIHLNKLICYTFSACKYNNTVGSSAWITLQRSRQLFVKLCSLEERTLTQRRRIVLDWQLKGRTNPATLRTACTVDAERSSQVIVTTILDICATIRVVRVDCCGPSNCTYRWTLLLSPHWLIAATEETLRNNVCLVVYTLLQTYLCPLIGRSCVHCTDCIAVSIRPAVSWAQ